MPLFNLSVCVTFVLFTDCDSCTRPISTNPVSMEAGEYGLTRGTCVFARRLDVVAVTGLLRLSWCVWGGADIFSVFFFSIFFLERTRPAASMRPPLASVTSLLVPGCVQGAIINLSVCVSVSVFVTFVVFTDCESCTRPISTNPISMEAGEYGLTRGTCFFVRRLQVVAVARLL